MVALISILNYASILFFGIILAFKFVGIGFKEHKKLYLLTLLGLSMLQLLAGCMFSENIVYKIYPLLIHFPLFLILMYICKQSPYLSMIGVLSAYLFCTPRKWLGTGVAYFFDYNPIISDLTEILITIPMLIFIIIYIAPNVALLAYQSTQTLKLFIAVPLFYYIIAYLLTVYTDLLYTGGPVVKEFMDAFIVTLYFIFSILYLKNIQEKATFETNQHLMQLQLASATEQILRLRESDKQAAIYHHDLVHHMNFINACINENNCEEAKNYIHQTCKDVITTQSEHYTDNESVNLILCSYIGQSKAKGILTEVTVTATNFDRFSIMDLCSLLSNALSNAIMACDQIPCKKDAFITLKLFENNDKLCLSLSNTYVTPPVFQESIPISKRSGHGIGIKSIIQVIEKYNGIYRFTAEDGVFLFQASL